MCYMFMFFFFQQKTAYEMRISDLSSDVCSSDLKRDVDAGLGLSGLNAIHPAYPAPLLVMPDLFRHPTLRARQGWRHVGPRNKSGVTGRSVRTLREKGGAQRQESTDDRRDYVRSEEHTSELQSLMRISYAVFCLKKKKYNRYTNITKIQSTNDN